MYGVDSPSLTLSTKGMAKGEIDVPHRRTAISTPGCTARRSRTRSSALGQLARRRSTPEEGAVAVEGYYDSGTADLPRRSGRRDRGGPLDEDEFLAESGAQDDLGRAGVHARSSGCGCARRSI